jgi:hypothetical protein
MVYLKTIFCQFLYILDGPEMVNLAIINGHLENLVAIWYTFGPVVYFAVIWYIFPILVCLTKKIWQPWLRIVEGNIQINLKNTLVHNQVKPYPAEYTKIASSGIKHIF